jgi:hypothetical protein
MSFVLNPRKKLKRRKPTTFKRKIPTHGKQKRDYTPKMELREKGLKTETMGKCTNMKR